MYERDRGSKRLATVLKGLTIEQIESLSRFLNYYPDQLIQDIWAVYNVCYGDPDPDKEEFDFMYKEYKLKDDLLF